MEVEKNIFVCKCAVQRKMATFLSLSVCVVCEREWERVSKGCLWRRNINNEAKFGLLCDNILVFNPLLNDNVLKNPVYFYLLFCLI